MLKDLVERKEYYKDYYQKNKGKLQRCNYVNGIHREVLRRFGRDPEVIFERDGWKCQICGSIENLTIDHIDGNGRHSKRPNNNLENLRTLCRSCHGSVDGKKGMGNHKWYKLPLKTREKMLSNLKYWKKKTI